MLWQFWTLKIQVRQSEDGSFFDNPEPAWSQSEQKRPKTLAKKFGSGGNIDLKNALAEVQTDLEFAGVGEQNPQ